MAFTKPSIVLADDHEPMLSKISGLLSPHYNVVAAVGNGGLAVQAVITYQPDLVLLDISMPQMNGIEAARKIRHLGLSTGIVFLTVQFDSEYLEVAHSLGASYVLKNQLHSDLLVAIKETLAGRIFSSVIPTAKF
jgi:DNA-binding NarL/FixJ family response regulator